MMHAAEQLPYLGYNYSHKQNRSILHTNSLFSKLISCFVFAVILMFLPLKEGALACLNTFSSCPVTQSLPVWTVAGLLTSPFDLHVPNIEMALE